MKITEIKVNPDNPQIFDDIEALKKSIKEFPKMMELRPMIYDPITTCVLGGNKRLTALIELGYKEIPDNWVKSADNLNDDEKKRFVIADNVGFGEWDKEILLRDYEIDVLSDWGLDLEIDYGDSVETSNKNEGSEDGIDYDMPVANELGFSDNYIIVTFKNNDEYNQFVEKNNIGLEKSANFKDEKLIEFETKRVFNYEDLYTILK